HLEREDWHLVIADLDLGGSDSVGLPGRTRPRTGDRTVPLVAIARDDQFDYARAAGFDACVRKPVDAEELQTTIDLLASDGAAPSERRLDDGESLAGPILDRTRMLEHIGASADLLVRVVRLFEQDGPQLQAEARQAGARGDCDALQRAAHRLKGSLG